VLIERSAALGRGVAYAQRACPYLLNVPAGRMSASSHAPQEFVQFAQRRIPDAEAHDFLPRALYGEYLEKVLLAAQLSAAANVRLDVWQGEVGGVFRIQRHLPLQVVLADGRRLTADDVVLATGNPPPASCQQPPHCWVIRPTQRTVIDADGWPRHICSMWGQCCVLICGKPPRQASCASMLSNSRPYLTPPGPVRDSQLHMPEHAEPECRLSPQPVACGPVVRDRRRLNSIMPSKPTPRLSSASEPGSATGLKEKLPCA
jgi:hypothetical protein